MKNILSNITRIKRAISKMYRDAYQRGMLTIFFSGGSKPLANWDVFIQSGYVNRFLDQEIKTMVLEIGGSNISTTYMICPKGKQVLGIHMPFMVMIVKNLMKYFSFEVTILDETGTRRRFRVSNFQSKTQILPLCTVMPIGLTTGWNQIQFNLAEFTRRAYNKQYVEVQKVKINANIRLRRIYFTERLMLDDELPPEYKLYFPLPSKQAKKLSKEKIPPAIEKRDSKIDVNAPNLSTTLIPIMPNVLEQDQPPIATTSTEEKKGSKINVMVPNLSRASVPTMPNIAEENQLPIEKENAISEPADTGIDSTLKTDADIGQTETPLGDEPANEHPIAEEPNDIEPTVEQPIDAEPIATEAVAEPTTEELIEKQESIEGKSSNVEREPSLEKTASVAAATE